MTTAARTMEVTHNGETKEIQLRVNQSLGTAEIWYAGDVSGEMKKQMGFESVTKAMGMWNQMIDSFRSQGMTVAE